MSCEKTKILLPPKKVTCQSCKANFTEHFLLLIKLDDHLTSCFSYDCNECGKINLISFNLSKNKCKNCQTINSIVPSWS